MLTSAALATAAGSAWPWLAQAAQGGRVARAFAIVDSTLACGASFARYAGHLQLPVFDIGDDAGALWFTTLAPLLDDARSDRATAGAVGATGAVHATPSLIGFTRASDYFILRHLALRGGRFVEHSHEQRVGPHALPVYVAFALTPGTARVAQSAQSG
ncbi:hypothetical protein [Paraburkholderia antibiotica]